MKVLICGDYAPKNRIAKLLDNHDYSFFSQVKEQICNVDYSIVNLESPIINNNAKPIEKTGPNLCCTKATIDSIKYAGFNCVTLANNHFRDFGQLGVDTTIDECILNNIDYVGGGKTLDEASKILYKNIQGIKIAFLNICEQEWSIATKEYGGSNLMNPVKNYYEIQEAKKNADYVIVIVHGGVEHYNLPTPTMQQNYRFFIDSGADIVINHHQHCFSGYEEYHSKLIFYGLGNFCFDRNSDKLGVWEQGYFVLLNINKITDKIITTFKLIPYYQCRKNNINVSFNDVENSLFNEKIKGFNSIIQNENKLNSQYNQLINLTYKNYVSVLSPYDNKYLKFLSKKGLLPKFIHKNRIKFLLNLIRCDSHRERMINSLVKLINNK